MTKNDLPVYRALGIPYHPVTMEQTVERVEHYLQQDQFHLIVTLGTEMVMRAQQQQDFRDTVERADLVVPDGVGLVLASRYCGLKTPERVAGIELLHTLCRSLSGETRFFLLGAAPGVAEEAAQTLRQLYPQVNIVGCQDGYFQDEEEVFEKLSQAEPDVLLVGLGSPRQEVWMDQNRHRLPAKVGVGVGGSFDVLAGRLERAPEWMIRLHTEWFYRLLQQPSRWLRMLALPRFVLQVLLSGRKAVVEELA